MDKAAVFIDGGYLSSVLKKHFGEPAIDYTKFADLLCDNINSWRMRTYYYTCMPFTRKGNLEDRKRYDRMQRFLDKLRRLPRFEVKLGRLQMINDTFKQKMVDVKMSLDIVDMSFNRYVDSIVLVAGDSDFMPAIKKAKQYGVIVHLYYHPSSVHKSILDEVDAIYEIDTELINNSKLDSQ